MVFDHMMLMFGNKVGRVLHIIGEDKETTVWKRVQ